MVHPGSNQAATHELTASSGYDRLSPNVTGSDIERPTVAAHSHPWKHQRLAKAIDLQPPTDTHPTPPRREDLAFMILDRFSDLMRNLPAV